MSAKPLYRIKFRNEEKIFELYARRVGQGEIFGFIEIAQLVWGKKSAVIIDPTEQQLRHEFEGVKRFQVPLHSVIRIDEVDKGGSGKVIAIPGGAKGAPASPIYTPRPKDE